MDLPYDHIQEETLSPTSETPKPAPGTSNPDSSTTTTDQPLTSDSSQTLPNELTSAFTSLTTSPWGSTLGSWFTTAKKQSETFYQDLQSEVSEAQEQATKGFSSLREQVVSRTRSLSLNAEPGPQSAVPGEEGLPAVERTTSTGSTSGAADSAVAEAAALESPPQASVESDGRPESLPADIVKEAGSLVASLRSTAASKLKDLQKAEDAADEALLKFGANVRSFLRDAVTVTAPAVEGKDESEDGVGEVLFETKEEGTGKKVFHSSRLEAQLHAIHTTGSSFTSDPSTAADGEAWEDWKRDFDIDKKTEDIAKDLERCPELRRAMERLVPEKVDYRDFWRRYYFLREAVEVEERRRREVLKEGASSVPEEEEVGWDVESDDENETSTPNTNNNSTATNKAASESTTTLNAPPAPSLKPPSPRRSHEDEIKSVADSDASYDIVSGTTSRATGSPKEEKRKEVGEESEEDDWE